MKYVSSDQLEDDLNHQVSSEFFDSVYCSVTCNIEYSVYREIISGMGSMIWESTTNSAIKIREKLGKSL